MGTMTLKTYSEKNIICITILRNDMLKLLRVNQAA